jgi:hypothetical protein
MKRVLNKFGRGLLVSDDGTIERLEFTGEDGRVYKQKRLSPSPNRYGYYTVNIRSQGTIKTMSVHRVVAEAFMRDFSADLQVDHIDGCRSNNHITNLRLVTPSRNKQGYVRVFENASSRFRGVSWNQRARKWTATIGRVYLGRYNNEADAALAYNKAAIQKGWPKECLNEVPQ